MYIVNEEQKYAGIRIAGKLWKRTLKKMWKYSTTSYKVQWELEQFAENTKTVKVHLQ